MNIRRAGNIGNTQIKRDHATSFKAAAKLVSMCGAIRDNAMEEATHIGFYNELETIEAAITALKNLR